MEGSRLPRPGDFHIFQQDDTWYLFLTVQVAVFHIDEETAMVLRRHEIGHRSADGSEQERLRHEPAQ